MPFLDSHTIRPLYDVHDGGPPVGFRCCLGGRGDSQTHKLWTACNRVTRTLAGMRTHQRIVHGIKQQQEFHFETVLPTRENHDL
jgi:hypothetical protein